MIAAWPPTSIYEQALGVFALAMALLGILACRRFWRERADRWRVKIAESLALVAFFSALAWGSIASAPVRIHGWALAMGIALGMVIAESIRMWAADDEATEEDVVDRDGCVPRA